jgi:hypothetical protein
MSMTPDATGVKFITVKDNRVNSWWYVDLGAVLMIDSIRIFNRTDFGAERLRGAIVRVSNQVIGSWRIGRRNKPLFSKNLGSPKRVYDLKVGVAGRYVEVWSRKGEHLQLAEVMVIGKPESTIISHLAKGKRATQSSTYPGGDAANAVDGNTNGIWRGKSVSHTLKKGSPWWQVDLGAVYRINQICVFNRRDCCGERLNGAVVMVSELPFRGNPLKPKKGDGVGRRSLEIAGPSKTLTIARKGRYVRVQIPRNEHLQLAEVAVLGHSTPTGTKPKPRPRPKPSLPSPPPLPAKLTWAQSPPGVIPKNAVAGGQDAKGQAQFICQATHQRGTYPGKIVGKNCSIGFGGKEVLVRRYKV